MTITIVYGCEGAVRQIPQRKPGATHFLDPTADPKIPTKLQGCQSGNEPQASPSGICVEPNGKYQV
jgi:hypothetical protein